MCQRKRSICLWNTQHAGCVVVMSVGRVLAQHVQRPGSHPQYQKQHKLWMVANACDPSAAEAGARGSEDDVTLSYIVSSSLSET